MSAIEFPAELMARFSDPSALIPAIAQDAVSGEVGSKAQLQVIPRKLFQFRLIVTAMPF